jgi:enoyl-CoA hydratase/carnithine racemase
MTDPQADVLFEQRGQLGLITLNRPQALNALNRAMCNLIRPQLAAWAADPSIKLVAIRGAGDRAFCAGGDIVKVAEAGKAGSPEWEGFFFDEYRMNHAIGSFPKPYVALLDGIFMGGGVGLSVHGSHRVVSEKALFAMPETGIGLIPDVGGTHLLGHMAGGLGQYLALTGERLKAADCLHAGIATHFVPTAQMAALLDALATTPVSCGGCVDTILERFQADPGPAPLAAKQAQIDAYFQAKTLADLLNGLSVGDDWAVATRDHLLKMSPTSMALTFQAVANARAGGYMLAQCLTQEYRIVCGIKAGHDFYEGVRAQLIDKDRNPRWKPAALADVTEAEIARHFGAPATGDLVLP